MTMSGWASSCAVGIAAFAAVLDFGDDDAAGAVERVLESDVEGFAAIAAAWAAAQRDALAAASSRA